MRTLATLPAGVVAALPAGVVAALPAPAAASQPGQADLPCRSMAVTAGPDNTQTAVVTVDGDGDVHVLDGEVWHCPPYES